MILLHINYLLSNPSSSFFMQTPPAPPQKKKKEKKHLSLNCIHVAREVSLFQSFLHNLVRGTTMDVCKNWIDDYVAR